MQCFITIFHRFVVANDWRDKYQLYELAINY